MRTRSFAFSLIAATALAAPLGLAIAAPIELSARKSGQWQVEVVAGAMPSMTMQVCLDAATDAEMMQAGLSMSEDMCPEMNVTQTGGTITIDAKCSMGPMKTTSHTVISGDFQSAYHIEVISDIEGGPKGMPAHSTVKQTAKWVGECANGLAPGDMMMPNGMKMNMRQILKPPGG